MKKLLIFFALLLLIYASIFIVCSHSKKYQYDNFADRGITQTVACPFGNNHTLYTMYLPMIYTYYYLFDIAIIPLNEADLKDNPLVKKL